MTGGFSMTCKRRLCVLGVALAAAAFGPVSGEKSARAQEGFKPEQGPPADPVAIGSLRDDLERIVEIQSGSGWQIDKYEMEDMMPSALSSVCRVVPRGRSDLLALLDARIKQLGGPVEEAWARTKDLSDVKELLFVTRVRDLLAEATRRAAQECPFWVEPALKFKGLQSDFGTFAINVETGGMLQLRRTEGRVTYGGGGVFRLLLSRGFGDVSLMAGAEFAGGAMLKPGAEQFVINYFPAIPVVVRLWNVSWHYDLEAAPVALFQADDTKLSYGLRLGAGLGVQSRRARGVIPWGGFHVAYEHYFTGHRPAAEFMRAGLRVGIIW
ncbi:MAG: hypothetical protein ABI175_19395 [Polyangiales bacterium]